MKKFRSVQMIVTEGEILQDTVVRHIKLLFGNPDHQVLMIDGPSVNFHDGVEVLRATFEVQLLPQYFTVVLLKSGEILGGTRLQVRAPLSAAQTSDLCHLIQRVLSRVEERLRAGYVLDIQQQQLLDALLEFEES